MFCTSPICCDLKGFVNHCCHTCRTSLRFHNSVYAIITSSIITYDFTLSHNNNIILLLQAKLQEFLGRRVLDKHLDADEAIVLGASLHAANLSDGIKLNRKLGMIDGSTYAFMLEIDGPDYVRDESIDQILVPRMKKMPIKVSKLVILFSSNSG